MKIILLLIFLYLSPLFSTEKQLILAEGNGWFPHMAKNLIANHDYISKLPFSGFVMVGNHYTDLVMQKDRKLTYDYVWNEVKGIKNLYPNKKKFLQINIHFPADFWDDKAWKQVSKNFAIVAKVAKDLGFVGVVFDDEPYSKDAQKMINFKFPTKKEVEKNPNKFTAWEKKGAESAWVDTTAYRNPNHTFKEHTDKITSRFQDIMSSMVKEFPQITTLVYLGPSLSHENSNRDHPLVIDLGLPREHELNGAIFTGLKAGLSKEAELYDMGESYKYRKDEHFEQAYQWRKYNIAKDSYNDDLNESYQWVVPKSQRASWSKEVNVGFMVFNIPQNSTYPQFNTLKNTTVKDVGETLNKALKYADKYVIYYCEKQDWLYPKQKYPLKKEWLDMMKKVYSNIK